MLGLKIQATALGYPDCTLHEGVHLPRGAVICLRGTLCGTGGETGVQGDKAESKNPQVGLLLLHSTNRFH